MTDAEARYWLDMREQAHKRAADTGAVTVPAGTAWERAMVELAEAHFAARKEQMQNVGHGFALADVAQQERALWP